MKNILILFSFTLLASSCSTSKYGCSSIQSKKDCSVEHIPVCRGYGKVVIIDSINHTYVIRIPGSFIKDDTGITDVKFVIVHDMGLQPYIGKSIYFECKSFRGTIKDEIVEATNYCVEKVENSNLN